MGHLTKHVVDVNSITLREIRELVDFHNAYYKTDRKPEHWIWQYKGYEPRRAVFTTVRDNGRLVGTQAMMPVYFSIDSKPVLTGKGEHTLILPGYRGSGVMQDLYEFAVEQCKEAGYRFLWGFTDAAKATVGFGYSVYPIATFFSKLGPNIVTVVSQRLRSRETAWRRILSAGKGVSDYMRIRNLKTLTIPGIHDDAGATRQIAPIKGPQIGELHRLALKEYPDALMPYYDDRYINWRIRNHPFLRYSEYGIQVDRLLKAYAFVTMSDGIVSISDIHADSQRNFAALLARVVRDHAQVGKEYILFINPRSSATMQILPILNRFGFYRKSVTYLAVRDLSQGRYSRISEIENWNISGLWTEGYQM